jgi:chitin synthase
VSSKKGKEDTAGVIEETEKTADDLEASFKETVQRAMTVVQTEEVSEKPSQDDQNKSFRTRLVALCRAFPCQICHRD